MGCNSMGYDAICYNSYVAMHDLPLDYATGAIKFTFDGVPKTFNYMDMEDEMDPSMTEDGNLQFKDPKKSVSMLFKTVTFSPPT